MVLQMFWITNITALQTLRDYNITVSQTLRDYENQGFATPGYKHGTPNGVLSKRINDFKRCGSSAPLFLSHYCYGASPVE